MDVKIHILLFTHKWVAFGRIEKRGKFTTNCWVFYAPFRAIFDQQVIRQWFLGCQAKIVIVPNNPILLQCTNNFWHCLEYHHSTKPYVFLRRPFRNEWLNFLRSTLFKHTTHALIKQIIHHGNLKNCRELTYRRANVPPNHFSRGHRGVPKAHRLKMSTA